VHQVLRGQVRRYLRQHRKLLWNHLGRLPLVEPGSQGRLQRALRRVVLLC
jgi:hypothetical protein